MVDEDTKMKELISEDVRAAEGTVNAKEDHACIASRTSHSKEKEDTSIDKGKL